MGARETILETADLLFGEEGFEATTTRRIGDVAGINKGLIHYHFKDKEELWSAVLDRYYERLSATLSAELSADGDARTRFRRLIGSYFVFLAKNSRFARMVQREIAGGRQTDEADRMGHIVARTLPMFRAGTALFESAWPGARSGEMTARHVFVSLYGMAVTWVTHAAAIEGLVGADPLAAQAIEERRRHLERMVDIVAAALTNDGAGAPDGGPEWRREP